MDRLVPRDIFLKRQRILPKSMQNIFFDTQFNETIGNAITLAQIKDNEEKETMMDIIRAVFLFIIPRDTFKDELQKRMNISLSQIEILDKIIQQKIFEPLKNELEQHQYLLPKKSFESINLPENQETGSIKTQKVNVPKNQIATQTIPKSPEPLVKESFIKISKKEEINKPKTLSDLSLPEAAEVSVKKPEIKTQELKNFSIPTMPQKQQEKIRDKLLAAMQKRTAPPRVVETMKQLAKEGWKKVKQVVPKEKKPSVKLDESASSQVFSGEKGESFEGKPKTEQKEKTPYIFDVKLKEEREKEEEISKEQKPISYSKYKPKSPFGKA